MTTLDIAHRGASLDAPENTVEAFALAIDQGADMIETDLHRTRDGRIVLAHDAEIGDSELGKLTYAEVHSRAPGVPTLDDVLDRFADRIPFNLEIKRPTEGDYPEIEAVALEGVKRRGLLDRILFSSFYDAVLERIRGLEPAARIALLISRRGAFAVAERAARLGAEAVNPQREIVQRAEVERLHRLGYRVNVFTVDDPVEQARLIDWGVDGLFTNVPGRLRALLDQ